MSSNTQGTPQGNYDPTQPAQYPYGSGSTTQYGGYQANPYGVPPPPPRYPRRTNRWLILLIGVLILIVVISVSGFVWAISRPTATAGTSSTPTTTVSNSTANVQPTTVPTQPVGSPITPTPVVTQPPTGGYCGLGTWGSTSVSPNQTVQGLAVINGVYSVNGHNFAVGGTNKVGYIAVLEDSGTYTVNSSGTACQPFTGTPSQSDVQTVINAMVQDQRTNGCTGGCSVSRIQKFAGGNPDGVPTNQ